MTDKTLLQEKNQTTKTRPSFLSFSPPGFPSLAFPWYSCPDFPSLADVPCFPRICCENECSVVSDKNDKI